MGANEFGELGDGTYNDTNQPEMIVASNVTAIAGGGLFSLFVKNDGSLWAMGNNESGQLGDGSYNGTNLPEMIVASNVVTVAAGALHSLFLKSDGSLWAMGDNEDGQLGDATYVNANQPEMIVASNVTAIAANCLFSLFLKSNGSLWGMGTDSSGQLGDGTTNFNGTNCPEMIVASNVMAIANGWQHTLFLKRDGSLWAMGGDNVGQLGDGTWHAVGEGVTLPEQIVASGVTAIAGGAYHSLFLKNDGSLWGMGDDQYGQLGDETLFTGPYLPGLIMSGPPNYNQISVQLLTGGKVGLSYVGMTGTNYVLDRSFSLSPPNWVPQATNPAGASGILVFTNTPDATTNNFWRIRSAP